MPSATPPWTDRSDGFHVEYEEDEDVPLQSRELIASAGDGGCVEKYYSTKLDMNVAVKRMETYSKTPTNNKLSNEVDILRDLKHYHSIRILGSYTHQDWFNMLMEPVALCDLNNYLVNTSSVKVRNIEPICGPRASFLPKIMGCLAHGLHYIHKEPRVRHRDIKPANILLDGSRVLFADFGISKLFTETQTGTSGPSSKTMMVRRSFKRYSRNVLERANNAQYTSPERAKNQHRNKSCDIFSLACVFADIFTVYKGRTWGEFYAHRRSADKEGDGYFHRTVPAVIQWLESLATERCDVQIIRLLRAMFQLQPGCRPDAEQVWKVLTTCTTNTYPAKKYFCGPCCMPLLHNDPLLVTKPESNPSETVYASSLSVQNALPISKDLYFKTKYGPDQQIALHWVRNLRHWGRAVLDVVQDDQYPHLLARKRIRSPEDDEGSIPVPAKNEAEILRKVKHRHIVTLRGTYQQGNIYTLLFEPAADHDLRSCLELAELDKVQSREFIDATFLTRSFGCMANALACVHAAGYDHGDIRPENILVHESRIFLSKFSLGLKSDASVKENEANSQQDHRFIDLLGKLTLRGGGESSTVVGGRDREGSRLEDPSTVLPASFSLPLHSLIF